MKQPALRNDPIIKKYFNNEEIDDLSTLLNAFDTIMVGTNRLSKVTLSNYQNRVIWTIDQAIIKGRCCGHLISSELTASILESVSDSTFSKLFKVLRVSENERIRLYFWPRTIDSRSAFRQLVMEIDNQGINKYLENISVAGDVSLNLTHWFYSQIDLTDPKQRLLMAVDFIAFTAQNHVTKEIIFDIARKKSNLDEVQD